MGGDSDPEGGGNLQLLPQPGVRSSAVNHLFFVCLFLTDFEKTKLQILRQRCILIHVYSIYVNLVLD